MEHLLITERLNIMKTIKKIVYTLLLVSVFSLVCYQTHAATLFQQVGVTTSPNPVGSGARAMGMGGTFIGIADDATAASWNPAGLIQLETPEFSIVGDRLNGKEKFSSNTHPEANNIGKTDITDINYFSVSYPFEKPRNIVISINYQRLYDFERSFDYSYDYSSAGVDLMQDKHFDQRGSISAMGLAGAFEINPDLSLGLTMNLWTDDLFWSNGWKESYTESGVGNQSGVPVAIDTYMTDQYSGFKGINFNFGLIWNLSKSITLGCVLKTPFKATIQHNFNYSQTSVFDPPVDTTVTSQFSTAEKVTLKMPLSYGLGLGWRMSDALSLGIDVYRTDWSKYVLKDSQGNRFSPIDGRPVADSNVKDTTQIRMGGEYLYILPESRSVIPFRAGIFYDPEPSYGEVKDFYGIALSSGISHKQFIFDIAYQLRWSDGIDAGDLIATSRADVKEHKIFTSIIYHF